MNLSITKVELLREHTKLRQLKITFSNGGIVRAEATGSAIKSWVAYGVADTLLALAQPVIDAHAEWLRGGQRPEWNEKQ